jgi:hypothetical protein
LGSILSIGSAGSILSIGSQGSILSIGAANAILSIGERPRGDAAAAPTPTRVLAPLAALSVVAATVALVRIWR